MNPHERPARKRARLRFGSRPRVALEDAEPGFLDELEDGLVRIEPALAAVVGDLNIVDACRCNDPECASFYTVHRHRAAWLWHRGGRNLELNADVTIDLVGDMVIAVEAFRRPKLRAALRRLFPDESL